MCYASQSEQLASRTRKKRVRLVGLFNGASKHPDKNIGATIPRVSNVDVRRSRIQQVAVLVKCLGLREERF